MSCSSVSSLLFLLISICISWAGKGCLQYVILFLQWPDRVRPFPAWTLAPVPQLMLSRAYFSAYIALRLTEFFTMSQILDAWAAFRLTSAICFCTFSPLWALSAFWLASFVDYMTVSSLTLFKSSCKTFSDSLSQPIQEGLLLSCPLFSDVDFILKVLHRCFCGHNLCSELSIPSPFTKAPFTKFTPCSSISRFTLSFFGSQQSSS